MDNSLFRSVLQTVQKHAALTPDHFISAPGDRLLFDHRIAYSPLSASLPELGSQLSSCGLPPHLNNELKALLTNDLNEDRAFIEQTQQRLLQQLSTLSTSTDPTTVPSLVRTAFDAFHNRSINARIDALRREISEFGPHEGSASESEGDSDSELDLDEDDEDGEEEQGEGPGDEDDNAPMRPGEDVPPLETKYLPIFEALHERGKVLTKPEKTYLVNMTGMTYRQITIWFQNRRRGELKDAQRVSLSHTGSFGSCASSDDSGDEDLEQRLTVPRSDATFDIRSWRLTSALPIKASIHGSFPTSPTKVNFGDFAGSESGDTDLSDDSNEDHNTPPGLHVPSLSTSVTTVDSTTTANASLGEVSNMVSRPVANESNNRTGAKFTARVTKPLPVRRDNPSSAQATLSQTPFTFSFGQPVPGPIQPESGSAPVSSPHSVTSDIRGLTVQMATTPPSSTNTLQFRSSSHNAPANVSAVPLPGSSNESSPHHPTSVGSPQRNPSPTPSGHSTSSPRPTVKPLPRRTGCAPRPRPPPRVSPPSASSSVTAPSSIRASVVLPPSSNPSLGNTTLGSLLRPNQPAPKIPQEMEERLVAMAGRMGVGAGAESNLFNSITEQTAATVAATTRPSRALPSFGPTSLPRSNMPSGSTLPSISSQPRQNLAESRF